MSFTELDILITLLKVDADLDNTWVFTGSRVIFYNNRNKEVADATIEASDHYINVSGCICNGIYNGTEDWLTAEEVYGRWANYVMLEA